MRQSVYFLSTVRWFGLLLAVFIALWQQSSYANDAVPETKPKFCAGFNLNPHSEPSQPSPSSTPRSAPLAARVVARLSPGLLQPQVEALIKQAFAVQHIDWRASPHYRWSTDFELSADNWNSALTQLLRPYQLQLTLYANQTAVVKPQVEVHP